MLYLGHIQSGRVVFNEPIPLAEGTTVQVEPVPAESRPTWAERLKGVIGSANDLPSDMAEHHDHYIHGTPVE